MMKHNPSSLIIRLGLLFVSAMVAAVFLFFVLRFGSAVILESYMNDSGFQEKNNERRIKGFQAYINKNALSTKDTGAITKWVRTQPLILLEIYQFNHLLYSSYVPDEILEDGESPHYSWVSYYEVSFTDGVADVVIYADDTYRVYNILTVVSLIISVIVMLGILMDGCRRLIRYICVLNDEIQEMAGGNLDASVTIKGNDELSILAQNLDLMRNAFKEQKEREAEMYLENQTIITQMSHDLRTPMTVMQLYTDILKYNKCGTEQAEEYLSKIDEKLAQIKQLADNLFEYTLISRDQSVADEEAVLFYDAIHDLLSEAVAYLTGLGFEFEFFLYWPDEKIINYPPYMKRIMDNISSNLSKYASHDSKIRIESGHKNQQIYISFQNTISETAGINEGTHIGIASIKNMMKTMNGKCEITQNGSIYTLELSWPIMVGPVKSLIIKS